MAKIKVDDSALRTNASVLDKQIQELISYNQRLENLILRIDESWEGAASQVYVTKLTNQLTRAKQAVSVLINYKGYVEKTVTQFTDTDKNASNRVKQSF